MAMIDGYHEINVVNMQNAAASATAWSDYVDLQGYHAVAIEVNSLLTTADGSNLFTPVLYEADSSPAASGSYSAVSSDNLYSESLAARNTTAAGQTEFIGYRGNKRYLAVLWTETGTAVATSLCVNAILQRGTHDPIADDSPTTGTVT